MFRAPTLALLIGLSVACSTPKAEQVAPTLSLTDEVLELPLPENSSHFRMELSHFWNEGDVQLLIYDRKNHAMHQLDVDSQSLVQSTALESEGPNGIPNSQLYGMLLEHPDSLFLFRGDSEIIQMNIQGEFVRRIPVDSKHAEQMNVSLYPEAFHRNGNDFYIPSIPINFQWNQLEVAEILKTPSGVKFSPDKDEIASLTKFDGNFIGSNLNKPLFPKFHSGPNGDLILAYNYKDVTVIHPDQTQSVKSLQASMVPDEAPASNKDIFEDMDEFSRIFYHSNIYSDLHYFKDHGLLMRVVQLEEDMPEEAIMGEFLPKQYVLLFYNNSYEKIAEMTLAQGKYNATQFFSTPDGIYISLDHPQNPDLNEDVMRFEKIRIN